MIRLRPRAATEGATKTIERVLAPSDLTRLSHAAVELAASLAEKHHARLRTLHVDPADPHASTAGDYRELLPGPSHTSVETDAVVVHGDDAAESILREAKAWPSDLIVMATHGLRRRYAWGLGSVAGAVLRDAPTALLLVTAASGEARWPFTRILCPCDFSEESDAAVAYVRALTRGLEPRFDLLHVIEGFPERGSADGVHVGIPEYRVDLTESARDRLTLVAAGAGLPSRSWRGVVAVGHPDHEILRVARESGADLVVLGVHDRRTHDRTLAGLTLAHLVREAGCPILAVRRPRAAAC